MNLESQVCSLEFSKKLKELGVKQDSYFVWYAFENPLKGVFKETDVDIWRVGTSKDCSKGGADWVYSAFTVAELGEMLPDIVEDPDEDDGILNLLTEKTDYGWKVSYSFDYYIKHEKTEADARAKMLIWLIEKGHILA